MKLNIHGVKYEVEVVGSGPAMLLLHGFSGTHQQWYPFYDSWSKHATLISVDMLGHGGTDAPVDASRYSMKHTVEDLIAILDELGVEKATVLGYSMGGRIAISLALFAPERVEALILESTSPGLATEDERGQRVASDEQLADRIEENGIEWFAEYWGTLPLFASLKLLPHEQQVLLDQQRKCHTATGLANSLRGVGTGAQPSWWDHLQQLSMPIMLIVGEQDEKFKKIANMMISRMGQTDIQLEVVPFAGHNVHLEQPQSFDTIVLQYFISKKRKVSYMSVVPWEKQGNYDEIIYETYDGIAKITINRPEVRNAFTPKTVMEMIDAFARARDDSSVGVIILTGAGDLAFCSGGDQKVRGHGGYVGDDQIPRLNVLDLQRLIRTIPKPVVAMVAGYAIGGGHVLHIVCDLTIAADNARFGQTGPIVGSFDGGYGAGYLARIVGQKKAREIWYLCRQYDAQEALDMGLVNTVVPLADLEAETIKWCKEMLSKSPMALRFLKAAFNADTDGLAGIQQLAGDATLLYYTTDEAKEGRDSFKEKREPDFKQFPRFP